MIKKCCDLLESNHLKIAFIESASSGYLSSQFSIYKNSGAEILLGGLVSYDPSTKVNILKIEPAFIEKYTAESAEVTEAMAIHGKILFTQADIIVACTGLLKPGGSATEIKPEGTFFISILYLNEIYNFHYFIDGTPSERLAVLTEYIAKDIIKMIEEI
ncbi:MULTISPECIES: CinA family protein [Acinetobacter]|uniref:Nicotinamide-nucleotide amidase n=1 Tax=Acinetobacter kyonggiensis TaxID=595670 RepID=A0A1H3GU89_9GAMM|nr:MULTISPECIES: CinA family protein [Acinetobacter]OTH00581.1 damage-inducible protein CinA [Acinetobacter sp. ANC 4973]SDY06600.1 nicotinamide-nucleotide amidase [Acinetobacter kyonggiensis]